MSTRVSRGRLGAAGSALPWLAAAVAVGTVAAGLGLDASGTQLGVPHPPFIGAYGPRADVLLAVALPLFAAAVALLPRLMRARPAAFAVALVGLGLVLRLALAAIREGTSGWDRVFDLGRGGEAENEYLPSLAAFDYGPGFVVDRFAELVPSLPVHSAGHPPGLLLTMHFLGLDTGARLAAFCIAVGALAAPLVYALGHRVLDERGARMAGLLTVLAPGTLLFGATSADAVYLTLGLVAAVPLLSPAPVTRALGALALAAVSLSAWSLLAVGAWAALLVLARDGFRPAFGLAALCGAALLAVQGSFALATGFDPIGTLHATSRVYELGIASRRPYAYWLLGSPVAFVLALGAPIAWLALRRLATGAPEALAIAGVILAASVLGFTKAETERIWLFLAPFVILAAAPLVSRPRALAAALAAQALAYELLFDTVW